MCILILYCICWDSIKSWCPWTGGGIAIHYLWCPLTGVTPGHPRHSWLWIPHGWLTALRSPVQSQLLLRHRLSSSLKKTSSSSHLKYFYDWFQSWPWFSTVLPEEEWLRHFVFLIFFQMNQTMPKWIPESGKICSSLSFLGIGQI